MKRSSRVARWMLIIGASGVLPAAIMRCDKAALNLQRGLFYGMGESLSELALDQVDLSAWTQQDE
jgi:hypothetical protein